MRTVTDTPHPIKIWASELDPKSEEQARRIAELPFIHHHVALMPDAHVGIGSTVGTVIATRGAVLPAAVGVDIGCGMCAVKLPFDATALTKLSKLRAAIEHAVPLGREGNRSVSKRAGLVMKKLGFPTSVDHESHHAFQSAAIQMGSLGGGNHFIEICIDAQDQAWILLHSGSRNVGNRLASIHIDKAKGLFREALEQDPQKLPDPNLAYFLEGTSEFQEYIGDMHWAQEYARENRQEMLLRLLEVVSRHVYGDLRLLEQRDQLFRVDCHHNYCQREKHFGRDVWVTRKGAVSARQGEYGIVPGNMGAKSYIVRGKGNPESFHSCSHGAGRRMSRTQARALFNTRDLAEQTRGIECRKDKDVVDEIPSAYKDITQVMEDQKELVEPVYELRQIICVKGG